MAAAAKLDVSYMPFVIAVMMAASAGFATPIGYQTNLMVYGPGGYRFSDYVKIGVPLDVIVGVVTIVDSPAGRFRSNSEASVVIAAGPPGGRPCRN